MLWLLMFSFQRSTLPGANGAPLFIGEVSNSFVGEAGVIVSTGEVRS